MTATQPAITSNYWLLKQWQQVNAAFLQLIWFTEPIIGLSEKPTPGNVHLETQTTQIEVVWLSFIIGIRLKGV